MMTIEIYDNGGRTHDRYTVRIETNVYAMSECAKVNRYVGTIAQCASGKYWWRAGLVITSKGAPDAVQCAIFDRILGGAGREA